MQCNLKEAQVTVLLLPLQNAVLVCVPVLLEEFVVYVV